MYYSLLAGRDQNCNCSDNCGCRKKSTIVMAETFLGPATDKIRTQARGFATITVNLETRTLFASVYVDRLHHITMAHIHRKEGDAVVVPLFQYPDPETKTGYIFRGYASLQGPVQTMSQFLHLLRAGELFLNVHTTTHPKGEISGFLKTMI